MDLRGERIDLSPMEEYKSKIVLDLNDRYFDLSEDFDGVEENFDTSNVIWVRWAKRDAPTHSQENWNKNKIEYEGDNTTIVVSNLAEFLSEFGDVTIVKDSPFSAFVEFTSFDPKVFKKVIKKPTKKSIKKENLIRSKSVLKEIEKKLVEMTGIEEFEVYRYEDAEKFSSKFIHE